MSNIIEQLKPLAVDVKKIKPAKRNPKKGHGLEQIAASLNKYGQRKPIVVNTRTNEIEAGNGTYAAATKILKWKEIAAVFVEDDEKSEMGYKIADNRVAEYGEWDFSILEDDIASLEGEDDVLFEGIVDEIKGELFKRINVKDLEPGPATHAMSPNEYTRLVKSIKTLGILQPLLIREKVDKSGEYVILDGRQRFKAALELGINEVSCRIIEPEIPDVGVDLATSYLKGKPVAAMLVEATKELDDKQMVDFGMNKSRLQGYKYTSNYEIREDSDGIVTRNLRELVPDPLEEGTSILVSFSSKDGLDTFLKAVQKTGLEKQSLALEHICAEYLKGE